MTNKKTEILKKSLLIAALTSSFGVFISKALGLLYYLPLSLYAGEENMAFYSITYTYYDILLKISSAGIPFAIAALVAKYVARNDFKSAMVVRKLGTSLVMSLSFFAAFLFIFISGPLARQSMGTLASQSDVDNLQRLFLILLIALILVPYLSVLRSYYQGLKRLDLFASSQVLEQLVRVTMIIVAGYVTIVVLKMDNMWAIYMAIAAAGVAAFVAIVFFKLNTRKDDRYIKELVNKQEEEGESYKTIFQEIISLGVPYLLISIFGTTNQLINTSFFLDYVSLVGGMPIEQAKLSLGILQANCSKLNAIPQVLTAGFCAGLVPYLTESLETKDYERLSIQVTQIMDTVFFILIPVLFVFNVFAKDIYFIMYGNLNLELGKNLFKASNAIGLTDTVLPILSSVMITLRLKKEPVLTLILGGIVKTITFFIFVKIFWAYGMVISTCLSSIVCITVYVIILKKNFDISFISTFKRFLIIVVISAIMVIPGYIIHQLLPITYDSRLLVFVVLAFLSIIMFVTYYYLSVKCKLPQIIFKIKDPSIRALIKRFKM